MRFLNRMKLTETSHFCCLLVLCTMLSCGSSTTQSEPVKKSIDGATESSSIADEESEVEYSGCSYDDGTYSANVDYYNDETGFNNTYTLDVEVENCEVIQINFPNGGWLDRDHISPAELDDDGRCTIYGEEGKVYGVELVE
jgi:hypothetical protein